MEWTRPVTPVDDNTSEHWRIIPADDSFEDLPTFLLRRWAVEPHRLIQVFSQRYGSLEGAQEGAAIVEGIAKLTPSPGQTVD